MHRLWHSRSKKPLAVIALISALSLAGTTTALATSGTGTQNPAFTVFVSLSPDVVTAGQTETVTESIRNNTTAYKSALIRETLTLPSGQQLTYSKTVLLAPGKTYSISKSYTVNEYFPKGTYSLTFSATNAAGTSTATASFTIQ